MRDLQKEMQKNEDLNGVVNDNLRQDFKREKELNLKLREELKNVEVERVRILERINEL